MDIGKAKNDAIQGIGQLMAILNEYKDRKINSLTQFNAKYLISSRVYIEEEIASDPLVPSLLKLANQIFAGQVVTAIGLNNICCGGKTAREMLSPVSAEAFVDIVATLKEQYGKDQVQVTALEANGDPELKEEVKKLNSVGSKSDVEKVDATHLFCGRLMELKVGSKEDAATIYFYVQLFPYILPKIVLEAFISNNIDIPKEIRKAQMKAGEISFWKDYVFEIDRVAKRKKALMMDKDGILREVEQNRQTSLFRSLVSFFQKAESRNRNTASTITIIRKSTLDKLCRDYGLNMKNFADRQNIFTNTFGMMMFVYDPDYNTIDLYMNGIQARGEYNVAMVQSAAKKDDAMDIKQLLTIMAAGNAPKF